MAEENGQSRYIVMVRDPQGWWHDITTVTVPPRTKRKTIIEKAAAEVDQPLVGADPTRVRVLDEESAREIPIEMEEQPPRLKIG
jgi:hypothetical protein